MYGRFNQIHLFELGFPDMVLLWRAIVRETYKTLRSRIDPTSVAALVLLEEEANQIAQTEQNEGRLQAVDHLICKLLKLKDPHWTDLFPIALRNQHQEIFDVVTEAQEDLLKEEWAIGMMISGWLYYCLSINVVQMTI